MSLVPQPEMTEKNLEAHRANGRKSRGAATAAGKERARAANLRHGYYSQIRDEALEALGEDPAALAALIEGAYEQWRPANSNQAGLVERLARLQWRMDRAERQQQNLAAEHIKRVEEKRRERVGPIRERYVCMVNFLSVVQHDAARPDFYASPGYIHKFTQAFAGAKEASVEELLGLLHRLGKPQTAVDVPGPLPEDATDHNTWAEMLAFQEERGEENYPLPHPEIAVAEGEERAELREELRVLAASELDVTEEAWKPYFDKNWRSFTTAERDVLLADPDLSSPMELARREESTCFREFWRLGTILMKMQKQAEVGSNGVRPGSEVRGPQPAQSEVRGPESQKLKAEVRSQESGAESRSGRDNGSQDGGEKRRSGEVPRQFKNEGASGDVEENKGGAKPGMTQVPGSLATETTTGGRQLDVEAA